VRFARHDTASNSFRPVAWAQVAASFERLTEATPPPGLKPRNPRWSDPARGWDGDGLAQNRWAQNGTGPIRPHPSPRQFVREMVHRLPPSLRAHVIETLQAQERAFRAWFGLTEVLARGVVRSPSWLLHRLIRMGDLLGEGRLGRILAVTGNNRAGEAVEPAPGDVVLAMGAPWTHPNYPALIAREQARRGIRFALLVHDIIPVRHPEWFPRPLVRQFRSFLDEILPLCDRVAAISLATAADVTAYARETRVTLPAPVATIPVGANAGGANAAGVDAGGLHPAAAISAAAIPSGVNAAGANPAGVDPASADPASLHPASADPASADPASPIPPGPIPAGPLPAGPCPARANPAGESLATRPKASAVRSGRLPAAGSYVLFVSTIEARKNHLLLFRVWRRLAREMPPDKVPTLVFAGRVGWLVEDLMTQIDNTNRLDGKLIIIEDATDSELAALYQGCLFTVFPSFYEGWGLPVTESLAFGKPCLIADRTSLPEAGGEFARRFDPDNLHDAFTAIRDTILDPEGLALWAAHIRHAFRPVSWAASADALLTALGMDLAADIPPNVSSTAPPDASPTALAGASPMASARASPRIASPVVSRPDASPRDTSPREISSRDICRPGISPRERSPSSARCGTELTQEPVRHAD
jgi:glycosyltransferase involved in cell wall biosynthesis